MNLPAATAATGAATGVVAVISPQNPRTLAPLLRSCNLDLRTAAIGFLRWFSEPVEQAALARRWGLTRRAPVRSPPPKPQNNMPA